VIRPDEPRQGDGLAVRKDLETVAGARGVARNSIFPGESRRAGQRSPVPPLADVVARHPHEWKPALGLRQRAHPAPRGLAHRPETHGHSKEKGGLHLTTVGGREPGRQRRGGDFNFKRAFFARRESGRRTSRGILRQKVLRRARRRRPVAVGTMQPRA
jgi:hypothetical protein